MYIHIHMVVKAIYRFVYGAEHSGNKSQAFLDKVGYQDLRSLLVLHQNIMWGGYLVALEAVQQGNTHHSRCRKKRWWVMVQHVISIFGIAACAKDVYKSDPALFDTVLVVLSFLSFPPPANSQIEQHTTAWFFYFEAVSIQWLI